MKYLQTKQIITLMFATTLCLVSFHSYGKARINRGAGVNVGGVNVGAPGGVNVGGVNLGGPKNYKVGKH